MANQQTILVIEDDKLIRDAIVERLGLEGFKVLEAGDGQQGFEIANSHHPDLILLDLLLPKMDGQTVLKKLRDDEWGKDVPVVIMTNLDKAKSIFETLSHGANYYLLKADTATPVLLKTIREVLGGSE